MKKNNLLIFVIVSACLFQSCNKDINKLIVGMWSIDTIYYQNTDFKLCLNLNVIQLNDQSCELPDIDNRCGFISKGGASYWEINWEERNPLILNIYGNNHIFNGQHTLKFKKDEINKLLKMEIESDDLLIICRKGLLDYDGNLNAIESLLEMQSNQHAKD